MRLMFLRVVKRSVNDLMMRGIDVHTNKYKTVEIVRTSTPGFDRSPGRGRGRPPKLSHLVTPVLTLSCRYLRSLVRDAASGRGAAGEAGDSGRGARRSACCEVTLTTSTSPRSRVNSETRTRCGAARFPHHRRRRRRLSA